MDLNQFDLMARSVTEQVRRQMGEHGGGDDYALCVAIVCRYGPADMNAQAQAAYSHLEPIENMTQQQRDAFAADMLEDTVTAIRAARRPE